MITYREVLWVGTVETCSPQWREKPWWLPHHQSHVFSCRLSVALSTSQPLPYSLAVISQFHSSWDGVIRAFMQSNTFTVKNYWWSTKLTALSPACLSGAASATIIQSLIRNHPATLPSIREWTTLTPHYRKNAGKSRKPDKWRSFIEGRSSHWRETKYIERAKPVDESDSGRMAKSQLC